MLFKSETVRNVLVLAPDKHIGDLTLSLAAIRGLEEHFREKHFYLVIDSAYAEIVEAAKGPANLLLYPRVPLRNKPFFEQLKMLFRFIREMRGASPDLAIDLHGGVASSTLTFLSGAPIRVGRSTAKRAFFYNRKVRLSGVGHKFRSYAELASYVGMNGAVPVCRMYAASDKVSSVRSILQTEGLSNLHPFVCIHPGAGVPYKEWSIEGFTEVADWLVTRGYQAVFIGGEGDARRAAGIRSNMSNNAWDLCGRLSFGELIALFSISSLFIGNDSGPMHLAYLSGVPVIALFGPADEGRWGPLSEHATVLRGTAPCDVCTGRDCGHDFRCVKTISAADVKAAVARLMNFTRQ